MILNIPKYIFLILTLLVVKESYGQNTSSQLYISENVTFYVGEDAAVHVENRFIQIDTIIYDDHESLKKQKEIKFVANKKSLSLKSAKKLITTEKVANTEKSKTAKIISLPFHNFPSGSLFKVNNKQVPPAPSTVNFKFKNAKKSIHDSNLVVHYFQSFLSKRNLQDKSICTTQVIVFDRNEIEFFHLSRPPPAIIV